MVIIVLMQAEEGANSDEQSGRVSPIETYARWRDSEGAGDNSPESSDKFSDSLQLQRIRSLLAAALRKPNSEAALGRVEPTGKLCGEGGDLVSELEHQVVEHSLLVAGVGVALFAGDGLPAVWTGDVVRLRKAEHRCQRTVVCPSSSAAAREDRRGGPHLPRPSSPRLVRQGPRSARCRAAASTRAHPSWSRTQRYDQRRSGRS